MSNNRKGKRQIVAIEGMVYDLHGSPMVPCTVRNVSTGGAQIELRREIDLPTGFMVSLSREGNVRRKCRIVWQFSTVAGVRFSTD